ncbi:LysR family transcriptional regulator [Runella sp.]|uniref:LysR family transcriptional regulator n=1 Tax=Runella sp. TaxID=1960881 RepID=UPI0026161174|nr:LysR substrate-binding domain-containing protein [Runella sp.]
MDLRQLTYFLGVAEELHFSRAAEKLFIVQPALSRQIQQLEEELGVLLFERDKRNVKLTPAGSYFRDEISRLRHQLTYITEQTKRIHSGVVGKIRMGHPGSALYSILPETLAMMYERFPDVNVQLTEIAEMELVEALKNYEIDVGFTREISVSQQFSTDLLFEEHFALVVPTDHWLNETNFQDISQCKEAEFILPKIDGDVNYGKILHGIFEEKGFEPKVVYHSNYGATILRLVEKKLGLSVLPISYRHGASSLGVRFLKLPTRTQLYLIWRSDDANAVLPHIREIAQEAVKKLALGEL